MSQPFSSEVLSIEHQGHVATLWLDRAEARNAMGPSLWSDLPIAMDWVAEEEAVRAVVIAARGPHFSVGLDLKAMAAILSGDVHERDDDRKRPSPAARARAARVEILRLQSAITAVAECPKPVIAAVHGYCIGGGVDLIAACDIRLASADALFSVREAKMAIVADLGSLQRLPRIIGAGHVAEFAFTGGDVDAIRAERIGLVNSVYPDMPAVHAAAVDLAATIAANSPLAVQGAKAVLSANDGRSISEGLDYVATWNAGMLASDDLTEALAAFMEKRLPRFHGR